MNIPMKQIMRVITAVLLLVTLMAPQAAFGASSSVSLSGAKTAKAGEVVTIKVTYRGDSLGYVNGHLTYDTRRLEYVSGGSSQGNAGLVQLKQYADNAEGILSFKVKFRAVGAGSVNLSLETLETQNLDGDADMGTPSASMTLDIVKNRSSSQSPEPPSSETRSSSEESETSQLTTESQEMESTQAEDEQNSQEKEGSIPYPLLLVAGIVIAALILVIAIRLKKKR